MKKRVLAALLVTMMTVGTVAGCGSNAGRPLLFFK